MYDEEAMAYACRVLNGSGFKVWCYLLKNKDGILWDISPADAEKRWGISKSTFHDGLRELQTKGFIDFEEGIIHQKSIKPECEIHTSTRRNKPYEIRIGSDTETAQEPYENQYRNNITNNKTDNNDDTFNDAVESIVCQPEDEFIF